MTLRPDILVDITPEVLLRAYARGIFPMGESADDDNLYWVEPEKRGIIPLDDVHVSRSLAKSIRRGGFDVQVDKDFEAVIAGCASRQAGRYSTWINDRIIELYGSLFDMGHCHTVEFRRDGVLQGGLYGVQIGAAFFGESMFSFERDASKIALVWLVARLIYGGFQLLDTQFVTDHLMTFGAIEINRNDYQRRLERALRRRGDFLLMPGDLANTGVLQLVSQMSKTGCSTA